VKLPSIKSSIIAFLMPNNTQAAPTPAKRTDSGLATTMADRRKLVRQYSIRQLRGWPTGDRRCGVITFSKDRKRFFRRLNFFGATASGVAPGGGGGGLGKDRRERRSFPSTSGTTHCPPPLRPRELAPLWPTASSSAVAWCHLPRRRAPGGLLPRGWCE
jgi:hypothetical protein